MPLESGPRKMGEALIARISFSPMAPLVGQEPPIEYARYVLTRGSFTEQHALAKGFHQKLQLKKGLLEFIQ